MPFLAPVPLGWERQLVGIAAVAAWLIVLGLLALRVRSRWPDQPEWSRKVLHIGSGPVILLAWGTGLDRMVAVAGAAAFTLLAAVNHRVRALPGIEDVDRHSYGTIAYGASITLLLLLHWPDHPGAAAAGVLVMALGDGLAGLIGPLTPSPSWRVFGQTRSLLGTSAMAAASLGSLLTLALFVPAPAIPVIAAIAATAVLLEQWAWLGIDNLTVPLTVGWLWSQFTAN